MGAFQKADQAIAGIRPLPRLYLMPGCGICHQVKGFLERHDIPAEMCWITESRHELALQELLKTYTGPRSVPFLVVGDEIVQGFQRDAITSMLARAGYAVRKENVDGAVATEKPVVLPSDALWVANFLDGSVSFVDLPSGRRLADDLSFGPESNIMSVAYDPGANVAAISKYGQHALVFFDMAKRTYLGGNAAGATLPTAAGPADIVVDAKRHRFYVPATQAGLVMAVDSRTGRFANGTLQNSSVAVGRSLTGGIAIDPGLDRIFVSTEGRLCAVDLDTFRLVGDGLDVGIHRGVAVNPRTHRVYVAGSERHAVIYVDGRTMRYAFGDLENSTVQTDRTPFAIAVDGESGLVFVSCMTSQRIQILDAASPTLSGLPPLDAAATTRTFAFIGDGLLAASSFDDGEVSFVDCRQGRYLNGARSRVAVPVSKGARGIAWVGGASPAKKFGKGEI